MFVLPSHATQRCSELRCYIKCDGSARLRRKKIILMVSFFTLVDMLHKRSNKGNCRRFLRRMIKKISLLALVPDELQPKPSMTMTAGCEAGGTVKKKVNNQFYHAIKKENILDLNFAKFYFAKPE